MTEAGRKGFKVLKCRGCWGAVCALGLFAVASIGLRAEPLCASARLLDSVLSAFFPSFSIISRTD